ncbi:YcxB family protein [Microbacterium sp. NPDC055903]
MTNASEPRAIRVDADLLRGMTADATLYVLTRPLALTAYTALIAAAVVIAFTLPSLTVIDPQRATTLQWTLVLLLALLIASVVFTRSSVRRAITTAMPADSSVRVEVGEESLVIVTGKRLSDVRFDTFRSIRVGRHAALLRLRTSSSVITAIPRAALDDEEIARLRSAIG